MLPSHDLSAYQSKESLLNVIRSRQHNQNNVRASVNSSFAGSTVSSDGGQGYRASQDVPGRNGSSESSSGTGTGFAEQLGRRRNLFARDNGSSNQYKQRTTGTSTAAVKPVGAIKSIFKSYRDALRPNLK